jgi:hypothetical protein
MQKNVFNLLLLALIVMYSCNKSVRDISKEPIVFEVNGIHDVVLDSSDRHLMSITVDQVSGFPEPVDIEVYDSTHTLWGSASGIPPFSKVFAFPQVFRPGVFSMSLVSSSQHYFKDYDFKWISPGNYFTMSAVHDIVLNQPSNSDTTTDTIPITFTYVSGMRAPITLSTYCPDYIQGSKPTIPGCTIIPSSGKPDFTAKFVFYRFRNTVSSGYYHYPTAPGTYRFYILANNSSIYKGDSLKVIVP